MLKKLVLSVLVMAFFAVLGVTYFKPEVIETSSSLISPLPKIFTRNSPQVLASTDFWKPAISQESPTIMPILLTAHSVISYDLTTNKLLLAENIHKRMPLASITKIMTAIVTIENENLDQTVEISQNAATIGENVMGLSEGERYTRRDLLYGLILPSGNDAAEALADTSSVGRENFVFLMNKKAEELGLTDTHFTNPSGLEGDGNQYSTVYDLLVMTKYGLEHPEFANIVSTIEHDIPASADHKHIYLSNETNLLTSYPGVKGVKTGYTYEAGLCLVTYLDYGGHKIIAVILNSENRRAEMKDILDYSLHSLGITPPAHQ
jgi:D-alanyl-D-alanine carboxypeptidase